MSGADATVEVRAQAVLVGCDRLVPGGVLLRAGRVEGYLPARASDPPFIVAAGLRNAHVHLDLSHVPRLRSAREGFAAWVLDLLEARGPIDPGRLQRAAEAGARECLRTGTVSVGDIDSSGAASAVVAASGLSGIGFREVLGAADPSAVEAWLDAFPSFAPSPRLRAGVSPHAPYSTSPELYRWCARQTTQRGVAWQGHLAETRPEREFLLSGGGEFRRLLDRLGAEPPFRDPPGLPPLRHVDACGGLPRGALVAHVNYPEEGDEELLARAEAAVVYCPRSHAAFGHAPHPVRRFLDAGVKVLLGTDSRASSPSLSLFGELRYLRRRRPDLEPARLWRMATEDAAPRLDGGRGRVEEGAEASLVLLDASRVRCDVLETVLDAVTGATLRVVATLVHGEVCYIDRARGGEAAGLTPKRAWLSSNDSRRVSDRPDRRALRRPEESS